MQNTAQINTMQQKVIFKEYTHNLQTVSHRLENTSYLSPCLPV